VTELPFDVVSDDERPPSGTGSAHYIYPLLRAALLEGKTIFVPIDPELDQVKFINARASAIRAWAKKCGRRAAIRIRSRNDVPGFYVWLRDEPNA